MEKTILRLINYWKPSFSLWGRFLSFSAKSIFSGRTPLYIDNQEYLGRWLFSGNYNKRKKKINPNAFMGNTRGVSVNRLTHAPIKLFTLLGLKERERRALNNNQTVNFYGYAVVKANNVRSVVLDNGNELVVKGSPSLGNPLHADIVRPDKLDKDFALLIADALLDIAEHRPADPL